MRRAFFDAVRAQFPAHAPKSNPALRIAIKRSIAQRGQAAPKERPRDKDPDVQATRARILESVGPALAWLRKNGTQTKGAYDLHTFGFRRSTIEEMLELTWFVKAIVNSDTGVVPTVAYIERVLREAKWFVDAHNEPEDFVQKFLGWRPRFAGDVILVDWTGIPIQVEGHVFEIVNRRTGKKERRFKKFGAHIAVDAATNYTWCDLTYGDNEFATWPAFLRRLLFDDLGYAPNYLIMDKVSGVAASLLNTNPKNKHIAVMPEVIACVAAGTRLMLHTPERANAKGHVEVAARLIKHRELNGLSVRRVLEKQIKGTLGKPRVFDTHAEAVQLFNQIPERANKRVLSRDGLKIGPRHELWNAADEQATRARQALDPSAAVTWREIVARTKLVEVHGRAASLRMDGVRYTAELTRLDEAGLEKIESGWAWIVPPLPAAHLDPEEYRVCYVRVPEQGGLPQFHALGAKISKKDRYGYDEVRPFIGEERYALPNTPADKTKQAIDLAAETWERQIRATGTTDSHPREQPVDDR
ncbi:MAG: hypothetical protein HS116_02320 [Planctomycetes bacterium]|nr:hypothetical protein [Planctomycetota bacterium]